MQTQMSSTASALGHVASGREPLRASAGSLVTIGGTQLPNTVQPNTAIDASVNVQNNAGFINPLTDKNACNISSFTGGSGDSVQVKLLVNGNLVDQETHCVPGGGGEIQFSLLWNTPNVQQSTDYQVEVRAVYGVTGHLADSVTKTVTVEGSAPSQPGPGSSGQPPGANPGTGKPIIPSFGDITKQISKGLSQGFGSLKGILVLFALGLIGVVALFVILRVVLP